MEKYSKWRDQRSGIHPFIPVQNKNSSDGLSLAQKFILSPILAIIKLPLLLVNLLWLALMIGITSVVPIPIIRRWVHAVGCRSLLGLLGFWWIPSRSVKVQRATRLEASPGSTIRAGDVILANHTSYVDVLYLAFRFAPVFTALPNTWEEDAPQGVAIQRSFWGALIDAIIEPEYTAKDAEPIDVLRKRAQSLGVPLVIFPEGCCSNGRTVLNCIPVLEGSDIKPPHIHVIGLKYEYEVFSPSYSVGSFPIHLYFLATQLKNTLDVRYVVPSEVPSTKSSDTSNETSYETWSQEICAALPSILRLKQAVLTAKDKREFKGFWYGYWKSYNKRE